jgi:hypothetical protein
MFSVLRAKTVWEDNPTCCLTIVYESWPVETTPVLIAQPPTISETRTAEVVDVAALIRKHSLVCCPANSLDSSRPSAKAGQIKADAPVCTEGEASMVDPHRNDIVRLLRACVTPQRLGPPPADTQLKAE